MLTSRALALRLLLSRLARALALGTAVTTAACASKPEAAPATPAPATPATAATAAAPATAGRHTLWRVRGPRATVYLLGSIHLMTADAYPLDSVVEAAYADADRVVFEVNLDTLQMRSMEMIARAQLPAGQTLQSVVSPETIRMLESRLPAYNMTLAQVQRFKPWMVSLLLGQLEYQKAGLKAEYGLDMHFNARAREAGKPRGGLETVDFQLGLFDTFTPADQEALLRQTLTELDSTNANMARMRSAWQVGNVAALDSALNKSMSRYPNVKAVLLSDRNRRWVPQIEEMLKGTQDVLIVVGAGHLAGPESVVALLRARGYTVEQL